MPDGWPPVPGTFIDRRQIDCYEFVFVIGRVLLPPMAFVDVYRIDNGRYFMGTGIVNLRHPSEWEIHLGDPKLHLFVQEQKNKIDEMIYQLCNEPAIVIMAEVL